MSDKQLHVFIAGRVQGVGFRYFVEKKAFSLNITGFVRNLADGRVEVLAEGNELILKQFLEMVKHGPAFSHVSEAEVEWGEATGRYESFSITF